MALGDLLGPCSTFPRLLIFPQLRGHAPPGACRDWRAQTGVVRCGKRHQPVAQPGGRLRMLDEVPAALSSPG